MNKKRTFLKTFIISSSISCLLIATPIVVTSCSCSPLPEINNTQPQPQPHPQPQPQPDNNQYRIEFTVQNQFNYGENNILASQVTNQKLKEIVLSNKQNIFIIPNNLPTSFNWQANTLITIKSSNDDSRSVVFELKLKNATSNNLEIKKDITFNNWKQKEQSNNKYPANLEELRNTDPNWLATQSKYDSRDFGIVKQYVENQFDINGRPLNTCWTFATAAASEVSILKEGINPDYISGGIAQGKQQVIDINEMNIDYITNVRKKEADLLGLNQQDLFENQLNSGKQIDAAANALMQWNGVANFNGANSPDQYKYVTDGPFVLESYEVIPNTIENIKRGVAKYGALSFDYKVPDTQGHWQYLLANDQGYDHACTIIGWNDTIDKNKFSPAASRNGAWIVRNSWSANAHLDGNGYFYMSYDSIFGGNLIGYDYANRSDYENNYYWDGMGAGLVYNVQTQVESGNNDVAAVFPVKKASYNKKEFLKAVNVAIRGKDVNIDVKVYKNLTNMNQPDSGQLVFSSTNQYENTGCYTIKLPEEIELDPNSYFSVIAKASNATNDAFVTLNTELSKNDLTFYKTPNGGWKNFLTPSNRAAKIKAFTVTKDFNGSHNNNLMYAQVVLNDSDKRYGFSDSEINPEVYLDGKRLVKGTDYTLSIQKNLLELPPSGTSNDEQIVGSGVCIITGINQYTGTNKSTTFSIRVGLHPFSFPDVIEFDPQTNRCLLRVRNGITQYNQIQLPANWKWTYNKAISFNVDEDNYIEYIGPDQNYYRRTMFSIRSERA